MAKANHSPRNHAYARSCIWRGAFQSVEACTDLAICMNEPDDQMSLVRLLLYSNELDIEALIASTSTWQKQIIHPETMHTLVHAYGEVRSNLLKHAQIWPYA